MTVLFARFGAIHRRPQHQPTTAAPDFGLLLSLFFLPSETRSLEPSYEAAAANLALKRHIPGLNVPVCCARSPALAWS